MIPDGLEPSLPWCRPGVVAAGPRDRGVLNTRCEKWTHRESHPPSLIWKGPVCRTGIFLLDDEPDSHLAVSGSRGTRTHKRVSPATCFQDRFLIRPDDFHRFAGVGIEPTPSWVRARRCYQQQPPRSVICPQ